MKKIKEGFKLSNNDIAIGWDEASNTYLVKQNGSDGFVMLTFKEMNKKYGLYNHDMRKIRNLSK